MYKINKFSTKIFFSGHVVKHSYLVKKKFQEMFFVFVNWSGLTWK